MSIKGMVVLALAMALAGGSVAPTMVSAAQAGGTLGGRATDKAKKPYSDYTVRVRNVSNPAIIQTVPLNTEGQFSVTGLTLTQSYLVDLFSVKDSKVICTEGPYTLNASLTAKTDINIDCGKNPTAWLLAAGAGAAILAAATQSATK